MVPYKDKALDTYKKIIFYPYETNKIYLFRENIYFYVNQKNYMHFIMIDTMKYRGKKHYYISFKKLTTTNLLEETGRDAHIYETIPLALIRLEKIVREANYEL